MLSSPYYIEFHGGRCDGLRQPSDFLIPSTRLELRGPGLPFCRDTSPRRDIYHHRRTTVAFVGELPVVTFHMYFVGVKIVAQKRKLLPRWIGAIVASLRRFKSAPRV